MARLWSVVVCKSAACTRSRPYVWISGEDTRASVADVNQLLARAAQVDGWARLDGAWFCAACFRRWTLSAEWTPTSAAQLDRVNREHVAATRIEVR
jgi:hypothetical protein